MYIILFKFIAKGLLLAVLAVSFNPYVPIATARTSKLTPFETQEGKAVGEMPARFLLMNKHQPSKSRIPPMPKVWLAYSDGRPAVQSSEPLTVVVQLPQKAKKILRDHWQVACAYYYLYARSKRNREDKIDLLNRLVTASDRALQKLARVKVNAPNGRRSITENESQDLVRLVNTFARDSIVPNKDGIQVAGLSWKQCHLTHTIQSRVSSTALALPSYA